MKIVVVAFQDDQKRSVAYREFDTPDGAVKFYEKYLRLPNVRTISTRKVIENQSGSAESFAMKKISLISRALKEP